VTLAVLCLHFSCHSKEADEYRQIADFESMDAIWMSCLNNLNYMAVESDMVDKMERNIEVKIAMVDEQSEKDCKDFFDFANFNYDMIKYFTFRGNDYWIRDHGPVFVYNKKGRLCVVDFAWNQYGYEYFLKDFYSGNMDLVRKKMNNYNVVAKGQVDSLFGVKLHLPIIKSWLVMEGGAMESNGNGTLILSKALMRQRNPDSSIVSMERELKRVLGAKNIIWLNDGLAEDVHIVGRIAENFVGMGTGGHTDEFVRFADRKTILLASYDAEEISQNPVTAINYKRMEENYQILQAARDVDGSKFTIIRIPQPSMIAARVRLNPGETVDSTLNLPVGVLKPSEGWQAGDSVWRVACSSYLNYYLTNNKVFFQSYQNFGTPMTREIQVINIFKKVFPNREVVPINARSLNWYGGGLHCATLNQFKDSNLP